MYGGITYGSCEYGGKIPYENVIIKNTGVVHCIRKREDNTFGTLKRDESSISIQTTRDNDYFISNKKDEKEG